MTDSFAAFVAPARARSAIWRLVLGIVVMAAVYLGPLFAAGLWVSRRVDAEQGQRFIEAVSAAEAPGPTLILLATFALMALAPMAAAALMHRRGPGTLLGPRRRVIRDFGLTVIVVAIPYAVYLAIWGGGAGAVRNLPLGLWLQVLPLALVGVLVQTGAEELVFRGYLQQQIAARFGTALALILPTILFALAHFDPATAGPNAWPIVLTTGLFGLVAADLTRVTGSLGAAWGYHFANNVAALLVLGTQGTITGLALYVTPYAADDPAASRFLVVDAAAIGLVWLILRRVLRR